MALQQLAIAVALGCRLTMQKLLTAAVAATKLLSHPGELTIVRATFAGRPVTLCLFRLTPLLTYGHNRHRYEGHSWFYHACLD